MRSLRLAPRLTPVQRDLALFFAALVGVEVAAWVGISFGASFVPGEAGLTVWAVVAVVLGVALFTFAQYWWFHVYSDEREPALGEFAFEARGGVRRVREGEGSFRAKAPGEGTREEAQYRVTTEPGFVPRTVPRWALWFASMGLALVLAAGLVRWSQTVEDPLSPLLVAVILLGGAVMLGALGVGEMAHQGPWARHERRPPPEA